MALAFQRLLDVRARFAVVACLALLAGCDDGGADADAAPPGVAVDGAAGGDGGADAAVEDGGARDGAVDAATTDAAVDGDAPADGWVADATPGDGAPDGAAPDDAAVSDALPPEADAAPPPPGGCTPGQLDCVCGPAGCGPGLRCLAGLCVDNTGGPGGPCAADGACVAGHACNAGVCVPCAPGSLGCACDFEGRCGGALVCRDDRCAVAERPAPDDAPCFTACTDALVTDDGRFVACPPDGLMPGCPLDGRACVDGACLAPGEQATPCATDRECADFQACFAGRCQSECGGDEDCALDRVCHRKVCRAPCDIDDAACGAGLVCESVDGDAGVCVPRTPRAADGAPTEPPGVVVVDTHALRFDDQRPRAVFNLTNASPVTRTFTVRKLQHTLTDDAGRVETRDDAADGCDAQRGCPLTWLDMGVELEPARQQSFAVRLRAGERVTIEVANAAGSHGVRWSGTLQITAPSAAPAQVELSYSQVPDGQWTGTYYAFGQFGAEGLAEWEALPHGAVAPPFGAGTRDDVQAIRRVRNAFLQVWAGFRVRNLSLAQFQAALTSLRTESWRFGEVQTACAQATGRGGAVCYPWEGSVAGVASFTDDATSTPVPSGLVELPIVLNLATDAADATRLYGRIESADAMHYPGDPAVELRLSVPTGDCAREANGACLVFFEPGAPPMARVDVGGRYTLEDEGEGCAQGFRPARAPWLVDGFARATAPDAALGRVRRTCRAEDLPYGQAGFAAENAQLARANPIPDGQPRRRTLRVIDGAFINQAQLFLIVEERFESFLGASDAEGFGGYGYMLLARNDAELTAEDVVGAAPGEPTAVPPGAPDACGPVVSCRLPIDLGDPDAAVRLLLDGVDRTTTDCLDGPGDQPCLPADEAPHALCEATGQFDDAGRGAACPLGSRVTDFTITAGALDPAAHPCNDTGACAAVLSDWLAAGRLRQYEPLWTCRDPNARVCAEDRVDLVGDRVFFGATEDAAFEPLEAAIARAFRYKVRFRTSRGDNPGFAPTPCKPGSDRVPYCYDAAEAEAVRDRVDCLLQVWRDDYGALSGSTRARLDAYLTRNFSVGPEGDDGFERLYTELLVMLGDEHLTQAFASRYDLAGQTRGAFPGSGFEPGGVDLSGVAGAELRGLYAATQHYDEALERFYALAPTLWCATQRGQGDFVTPETVTAWFERVLRASTQKARAQSATARRYFQFDEGELARGVVRRAFAGAFLESVVMARMVLAVVEDVPAQARPQIRRFLEDAQARVRAALLDMQSVARRLEDGVDAFGFAPDHVPFVSVDVRETNAFERALDQAEGRLPLAAERERRALEDDRAFETDAGRFQAELVSIRNTYENQLADICGSFEAPDGGVYPATRAHAPLLPALELLGDPCGLVGNGAIHQALGQIETSSIELRGVVQQMQNVEAEIAIERQAVADRCGLFAQQVERARRVGAERVTLQDDIRTNQFRIERARAGLKEAEVLVQAVNCDPFDPILGWRCAIPLVAFAVYSGLFQEVEKGVYGRGQEILADQRRIDEIEVETAVWELEQRCPAAEVQAGARIDRVRLRMAGLWLEASRIDHEMRIARAEVERLGMEARALQLQQAEAEQLAVDVAAAHNDPNIRIARNDAVINAEVAFDRAIRDAYRATRVFEYFTGQSYAARGELYLTRLVSRGDRNLEDYLAALQEAFFDFEEQFGLAERRVMVLSLRDDLLRIPRVDAEGAPLSRDARIEMLRARLADPRLLDADGYLSIPFAIGAEQVSPVTLNHKVRYVEAELNLSNPGDSVAHLYLRHGGTSVVQGADGQPRYYRLPPLQTVLNPYFSGAKGVFDPEIYLDQRLRDRPLLATEWRLLINQRDEPANQDLDLTSLNDVRLFIYYTDFTEL